MTQPKKSRVRPVVPQPPEAASPPPKAAPTPADPQEPEDAQQVAPPRQAPRLEPPPGPGQTVVIDPDGTPVPDAGEVRRPSWVLDLANKDVGAALTELGNDVGYWVRKGRYNKVRVTREGKNVLPDIPVGAIMAAELATLAWAGPLRTALVNVAGRLMFKVELINDAQEHLAAAREHYARGDLNEAETEAVRALKVDGRLPDGFLLLGTLAKVRGNPQEALAHFQKARDLDPHGPVGRHAESAGRRLDPNFGTSAPPEKER